MSEPSRILIVDDEPYNIKVLTDFLRSEHKIIAVKSGEQALRVLGNGSRLPDLILLDIMMPGLDGYEVCKRRSFDLTLDKEIRRAARNGSDLSLILMDIDFFKQYNDRYGHVAGDTCLRPIARVLENAGKRAFGFTARYGGEEFAMILPDTGRNEALRIAESVRAAVAQLKIPHAASRVTETVSLSLGVASLKPGMGLTAHGVVEAADTSLYQAKQNGQNQTCFVAGDLKE